MRRLKTSGHRGAGVTAGVHDVLAVVMLSLVEESLEAGLSETPGTGVQRLLLGPDNGLGVGVLVKVLLELLPWEGVKLLNAGDGDVVDLLLGTVLVQSGVDLTSAENDTINLLVRLDVAGLMRRVGDDPLELRVPGELLNAGTGKRVTEKSLGEEDDESYG